jgi:hypothetical protein
LQEGPDPSLKTFGNKTQTELESPYDSEAFARPTVKKWRRRFQQARTDLFDNLRFGKPLTNVVGEAVGFMLAEQIRVSALVRWVESAEHPEKEIE